MSRWRSKKKRRRKKKKAEGTTYVRPQRPTNTSSTLLLLSLPLSLSFPHTHTHTSVSSHTITGLTKYPQRTIRVTRHSRPRLLDCRHSLSRAPSLPAEQRIYTHEYTRNDAGRSQRSQHNHKLNATKSDYTLKRSHAMSYLDARTHTHTQHSRPRQHGSLPSHCL